MTTCNECKKPKCDGEVTLYYEGAAFSCSICDNRFASGLAAIHRCHGHAPQPTAQPVDLTKLIGRVSAGKENYPYVHPPVILTTERDEIVLALRVLRVLRSPHVEYVKINKHGGCMVGINNVIAIEERDLDDAERILGLGGER